MTDIEQALSDVAKYRDLKYPVGHDRAALCQAAVVLADERKDLTEKCAGLAAAFDRMQEFHDCMEAQRKDEPIPEGHEESSCGDGVCYVVGQIIEQGIKAAKDAAPVLVQVRAGAKADAEDEIASMIERRSTEGYFVNELAKQAIIGWVRDFAADDRRAATESPSRTTGGQPASAGPGSGTPPAR